MKFDLSHDLLAVNLAKKLAAMPVTHVTFTKYVFVQLIEDTFDDEDKTDPKGK